MKERIAREITAESLGTACTHAQIARAEAKLDQKLPAVLPDLYLEFDGFAGPTGAGFLWPLFGDNGLVRYNLFRP